MVFVQGLLIICVQSECSAEILWKPKQGFCDSVGSCPEDKVNKALRGFAIGVSISRPDIPEDVEFVE